MNCPGNGEAYNFGPKNKKSFHIGFVPTALPSFLADGLRQFNQECPKVCIQLHELSPQEQEKALQKDEIDLALIGHPCPELKKIYRVQTVRKVPIALVLPDDHRLADRKAIDLAELGKDSFLSLHEKHFPGRPELMENLFKRANISPEISLKANSLTELLGLVAGGGGLALMPSDISLLPHPRVVFVKLSRPKMTLNFSAVWREQNESEDILKLLDLLT